MTVPITVPNILCNMNIKPRGNKYVPIKHMCTQEKKEKRYIKLLNLIPNPPVTKVAKSVLLLLKGSEVEEVFCCCLRIDCVT